MATDNGILMLGHEAAEDLIQDAYRIVVLDGGKVRRPNSAGEKGYGVLQNAPRAGAEASVMVIGKSKIELGGVVAENDYLKLEYVDAADAGKGVKADQPLDLAMGRCVAGGGENELGEILLSGAVYQVNIAS